MSLDVAGQPGRERKASGRCEVPRGLRDVMVSRMMSRDVGKGLDPKRDERKTSCTAGDEVCRGRRDMPREAGAGDRSGGVRRVAERKTHLEAEDTLEGGRCIRRRKMHRKAEEASEAEAKFEMERRGGRGFPLQTLPG